MESHHIEISEGDLFEEKQGMQGQHKSSPGMPKPHISISALWGHVLHGSCRRDKAVLLCWSFAPPTAGCMVHQTTCESDLFRTTFRDTSDLICLSQEDYVSLRHPWLMRMLYLDGPILKQRLWHCLLSGSVWIQNLWPLRFWANHSPIRSQSSSEGTETPLETDRESDGHQKDTPCTPSEAAEWRWHKRWESKRCFWDEAV